MKARNENGTIVLYPQLPGTYKSPAIGLVLGGFDTLDSKVHESEGFFEVLTPEYDCYTQKLSPLFFDEKENVFSCQVLELDTPLVPPKAPVMPSAGGASLSQKVEELTQLNCALIEILNKKGIL
jgi:hypothetical protein